MPRLVQLLLGEVAESAGCLNAEDLASLHVLVNEERSSDRFVLFRGSGESSKHF